MPVSRRRFLTGVTVALILPAAAGCVAGPSREPAFRLVRHVYSGDPSAAGTGRWPLQVLQGDRTRPSSETVPEQFVYATAIRRDSDPTGVTQCLRPADVDDSWLLNDSSGRLIQRRGGDDTALDVGNPEFRRAAARFLVEKCRNEGGQRWTGVQHDEINADFGWGWDGATPAAYPTSESWQAALTGYMALLAHELEEAGFTLGGNLGGATDADHDDWYAELTDCGMVPSLETYVCGGYLPGGSTANYADPPEWLRQVRLVERTETEGGASATPSGTRIVVHDQQDTEAGIRYSLASFLLATTGRGAYGADVRYDAASPYPECFDDALALGPPTAARTQVDEHVWTRPFRAGSVAVNVGPSAARYEGAVLEPHTGRIDVTA